MLPSVELNNLFKKTRAESSLDNFLLEIENLALNYMPLSLKDMAKTKLDNLNINIKSIGSSYFDYYTNTVYILSREINNKKAYLHEIFHAISTNKSEDFVNIGLMQLEHKSVNQEITEIMLARAINEGANTYFTAKALEKSNMSDTNTDVALSYCFMTNIFASLVNLLGEEECKLAHFSGDINQFLKLVRKECNRNTDSKIVKLILSMDTYFSVAQVNNWLGVNYTPDARAVLLNAYKALVDLYFFKYENISSSLKLDNILSDFYLSDDNKLYFDKNIKPRLVRHLEKRILKEYSDKVKNATHLDSKTLQNYALEFIKKVKNGEHINGNDLPEKLKCGEFYNYLLTCVSIVDNSYEREGLKTNNLQRAITQALFIKENNFMPKVREKRVQTLIDILASRIAVRAGIEVSDELILQALSESKKFNFYLMDSNPDYYKQLYPIVQGDIKFNPEILKKLVEEVYTGKVERYKLKKYLEQHDKLEFANLL